MKKFTPALVVFAALLALAMNLHSQAPVRRSTAEQLVALKAKNAELIEKQKATLLRLEETQKQAQQLRFFSARG